MSAPCAWLTVSLASVLVAGTLAGCGTSGAPKVRLTASPAVALWDRSRTIVVTNLHGDDRVTLRARTSLPSGLWSSSATFRANGRGTVDVARQAPMSGSYSGVSPMGLLWSEKLAKRRSGPLNGKATTTISARVAGRTVASTRLTQLLNGPGVRAHRETVGSTGFYGVYYSPTQTSARAPAVVLWGGSEGDLSPASEAGLLASHGIPALALAYFDDPGLPCRLQDIPLEYFVKAIKWLRRQPQVDPRRIWIMSASRGTEAELLVAAHFPTLVHGLVAVSPSEYVLGAYHGRCQTAGGRGRTPAWSLTGKPIPPSTVVPVHRITANLLLIAGGDDTVWPSYVQAPRILAGLPHSGAVHRYLYYAHVGHIALNIPYSPIANAVLGAGGTVASDSHAWISDWPATIEFITSH